MPVTAKRFTSSGDMYNAEMKDESMSASPARMTIELPQNVKERLEGLARATERSEAGLAVEAISSYVELQELQIQAGVREADAGDFASEDEVAAILTGEPSDSRPPSLLQEVPADAPRTDESPKLKPLSKTAIKRIRARLAERSAKSKASAEPRLSPPSPPPRYDEVFSEGQHWLDSLAGEEFAQDSGRLSLSEDPRVRSAPRPHPGAWPSSERV